MYPMILIRNANVFSPRPLGIQTLLVGGDRILWLGADAELDLPRALRATTEVLDLQGATLIPGLIDGHVHVTGGGGEAGFNTRVPPVPLSRFTTAGVTTVVGLLGTDGRDTPLQLEGELAPQGTSRVLSVRQHRTVFRFTNVPAPPVPSLGRDFSAPVIIDYPYSDDALRHLVSFDSDPFNRWDAGQRLAMKLLLQGIADHQAARAVRFPDYLAEAFGCILTDGLKDPAFAAEALALPLEIDIAERLTVIDPDAVHQVRLTMRRFLAQRLKVSLSETYGTCIVVGSYTPDAESAGRRSLRNLCLAYLMELDDAESRHVCVSQLQHADNMTDALAALTALTNCDCPQRKPALEQFYGKWQNEPLVVDKWLGAEAASRLPDTLARVKELTSHPLFTLKNPNKVYALLGGFGANQVNFHKEDGSGYIFMGEQIRLLDPINPQVAARMVRNFERWKRFEPKRRTLMRSVLEQTAAIRGISRESAEVLSKLLA